MVVISTVSLVEMFKDIIIAYGVCDEYSSVFKKVSPFYQRHSRALKLKKKMLRSSALITMRYQSCLRWSPLFSGTLPRLMFQSYFGLNKVDVPTSRGGNDIVRDKVVVEHSNIIEASFWKEHPRILMSRIPPFHCSKLILLY